LIPFELRDVGVGGKVVVELKKRKDEAEFGGAPWINWREERGH
jgi:hypothetical protein